MGEACANLIEVSPPKDLVPMCGEWYAVQTAYRCEQRAARDLTSKGFNIYLPLLRQTHRWKDRWKVVEVPAFSGYLFVNYESTLRERVRILETSGIIRLLGGNHTPLPVPEQEIEAVRRAVESGVDCLQCDSLVPGARVEVKRGPLAGLRGRLVRFKSGLRLVIAISVFSHAISAEVGLNDVEALHGGF